MSCPCGYHSFCINGTGCPSATAQRIKAERGERHWPEKDANGDPSRSPRRLPSLLHNEE